MAFSISDPETATFGAGCFWGVEEAFRKVKGVISTEAGYAGGTVPRPRYEEVCTGRTGHAEVVRLLYDPDEISYSDLLAVFWSIHDPTQKDRQGPDIGSNYRSVIFYHNAEQKRLAVQSRDNLVRSGKFCRPIVTEIVPATAFWRAEEYHQHYVEKQGQHCR
ncbi:MAG: peptide-methionine (S)-S-oxide reductase MsrA [Methanoregula sp.]|jgi:peptide-methionine (S)-S-oxide reductase